MPLRLALYQPDIPQNAGTMLRMAACLGVGVDIIGPAGFDHSDRALRRAGMDYLLAADIARHESFEAFMAGRNVEDCGRIVLLTTRAATILPDFTFTAADTLMVGRESAGVPDAVHTALPWRVRIPMRAGMRSLNVAVAAAMALGEALRQTQGFPDESDLGSECSTKVR